MCKIKFIKYQKKKKPKKIGFAPGVWLMGRVTRTMEALLGQLDIYAESALNVYDILLLLNSLFWRISLWKNNQHQWSIIYNSLNESYLALMMVLIE